MEDFLKNNNIEDDEREKYKKKLENDIISQISTYTYRID